MQQGFLFRRRFGNPAQADFASIVVGSAMPALCSVDSKASAFIGDKG